MKNIIFIAPPAAGKGTQSELLKENLGYIHLSTGDMIREVIASNSPLGIRFKNIIDKGNLISDEDMINLIKEYLANLGGKPFILDGFPRTLNQAKYLDENMNFDYEVVYLNLSEEEATKRITGRLTCSCGKSYNLNIDSLKPKKEGICDSCEKTLQKRDDDNIESFKVRYESFINNTIPLLEYYDKKNKLHRIDVNRSVEDIYEDILRVTNDKY